MIEVLTCKTFACTLNRIEENKRLLYHISNELKKGKELLKYETKSIGVLIHNLRCDTGKSKKLICRK